MAQYRSMGEAGLVDRRDGSPPAVDARWDEAVRAVLAESVNASTPTRGAVLARAAARLEQQYGAGVVPLSSQATGYRRLAELTKGTNAVSGSAKGRRSIADRPQGVYGRLRATRPGEYVCLPVLFELPGRNPLPFGQLVRIKRLLGEDAVATLVLLDAASIEFAHPLLQRRRSRRSPAWPGSSM